MLSVWKTVLHYILLLKDVLEDVFEAAIIGLEDGVLGAHVERPPLLDRILKAAMSKATDGLKNKDPEFSTKKNSNSEIKLFLLWFDFGQTNVLSK